MISVERDDRSFVDNLEKVVDLHMTAFAGPPWFQEGGRSRVLAIYEGFLNEGGLMGFLARDTDKNDEIVAASVLTTPQFETFDEAARDLIKNFFLNQKQELPGAVFGYVHDTVVNPDYQGQGLATRLKRLYLDSIRADYPEGVVLLTRHRHDNIGIHRSSEKTGFRRTGIILESSSRPGVFNEYWYICLRNAG